MTTPKTHATLPADYLLTPMKPFVIAAVGLGILLAFSACNTIRGMGRDIQSVGHGIERTTNAL